MQFNSTRLNMMNKLCCVQVRCNSLGGVRAVSCVRRLCLFDTLVVMGC